MNTIPTICITLTLSLFLSCGARAEDDANKLGLKALRALGYGELLRVTVKRDCRNNAALKQVPLCTKIDSIPDDAIEKLAAPSFNKHVSPGSAKQVIAFWESPEGVRIKKKLMTAIGSNSNPQFTSGEIKRLEEFNNSKAGREAGASANDKEASSAVIRALASY